MGRGTIRWIAIALVAAMVAALAVGLVRGQGEPADQPGSPADGAATGQALATTDVAALDGPHVVLELCTGVVCPRAGETAQQDLQGEVEADPRVASARLVSSEQAYQLFLEEYGDDQELVDEVDPDTVPAEIQVDLHRIDDVAAVVAAFEDHDGVASARDARTSEAE